MRLTISLSMPRERSSVALARHVLVALLDAADAPEDCRAELGLVITEACANAVMYAVDDSPIEIAVSVDTTECVIEIGNAVGADRPSALPSAMPEPLAAGGRGLPFIAAFADDARFLAPRPGWMVLRVTKRLPLRLRGGDAQARLVVTDHGRPGT